MSENKNKVKRVLCVWGSAELICREKTERVFELKKLCGEAGDIKCSVIDQMPRGKNRSSHIEKSVVKNIDVYEKAISRLEQDINDVLNIKACLDSWVSFLKIDEQRIITLRYRDGLSWDYIPDIIHKSRMQCFRIHNKVIRKLYNDDMFESVFTAIPV